MNFYELVLFIYSFIGAYIFLILVFKHEFKNQTVNSMVAGLIVTMASCVFWPVFLGDALHENEKRKKASKENKAQGN